MRIELALRYLGPPRDLGSAGDLEAAFEKRLGGSVEDACAAIGSCGTSLFSHIWKLFLEFAIRRKNDARRKIRKDRIRSIAPTRRLQARSFPAACPGFRPETRGWTSRSKHNDRGERSRLCRSACQTTLPSLHPSQDDRHHQERMRGYRSLPARIDRSSFCRPRRYANPIRRLRPSAPVRPRSQFEAAERRIPLRARIRNR